MLIGIGIYLIVLILGLDFFRGCKEKEIVIIKEYLEPLDLKKSGLEVTVFEEIRKCEEEDNEFYTAILKFDYNNSIEEFWDSVQTKLNVLAMSGISTKDVYNGLEKHKEKLKKRGYIFKS